MKNNLRNINMWWKCMLITFLLITSSTFVSAFSTHLAGGNEILPDLSNISPLPETISNTELFVRSLGSDDNNYFTIVEDNEKYEIYEPLFADEFEEYYYTSETNNNYSFFAAVETEPREFGHVKEFYTGASNAQRIIESAELLAIGEKCYIYVSNNCESLEHDRYRIIDKLTEVASHFDNVIYPMMSEENSETFFAKPSNIDGSGKITINL